MKIKINLIFVRTAGLLIGTVLILLLSYTSKSEAHQLSKETASSGRQLQIMKTHQIGSSGTLNSRLNFSTHRGEALVTYGNFQYSAYYHTSGRIVFIKRDLRKNDQSEEIYYFTPPTRVDMTDAHRTINLGIDHRGHLHVIYGMHDNDLNYYVSKSPNSIQGFTRKSLIPEAEKGMTYPTFFKTKSNFFLLYRDDAFDPRNIGCHHSGIGDAILLKYNYGKSHNTSKWTRKHAPLMHSGFYNSVDQGNGCDSREASPYWDNVFVTPNDEIYISFVWRTKAINDYKKENNLGGGQINQAYCLIKSKDQGNNWTNFFDQRVTPGNITPSNCGPFEKSKYISNTNGLAVSSNNKAFVVYTKNPGNYASTVNKPNVLNLRIRDTSSQKGYKDICISGSRAFENEKSSDCQFNNDNYVFRRPVIFLDNQDNIYVLVSRNDSHFYNFNIFYSTKSSGYSRWEKFTTGKLFVSGGVDVNLDFERSKNLNYPSFLYATRYNFRNLAIQEIRVR